MEPDSVGRVRVSPVASFVLSKWFAILAGVAFSLFFFGFATKWTFDPATIGTYSPGHYFSAQADAMLHGRLWIDGKNLPLECIVSDGHCYGYFGIAPSLIRLPFVLVLGVQQAEMTALFLAIAAGLALWSALDLCRRSILRDNQLTSWTTAGYMAIAAIVLGPGGALMLVSDAYVYEEAIMWSIVGMLVGVNFFWRWWRDRKNWQFIGATAAFVFAAGSRPTAALVGAVLAVAVVAAAIHAGRISSRALLGSIALAVLPVVAVVGVFFAKFDAPLPPSDGYEGNSIVFMQQIIKNNGGESGSSIRFVPTAAFAYLRPDALRIVGQWPQIRFRFGRPYGDDPMERIAYLPPLQPDSMNVEPNVSLTDVMPVPLAMTALAAVSVAIRRRRRIELVVMAALITPLLILFTTQTIATRYLGDFFPLVAVGTAFGASVLPRFRRLSWNARFYTSVLVVGLTCISIPVALMLASQYNWTYRYGIK